MTRRRRRRYDTWCGLRRERPEKSRLRDLRAHMRRASICLMLGSTWIYATTGRESSRSWGDASCMGSARITSRYALQATREATSCRDTCSEGSGSRRGVRAPREIPSRVTGREAVTASPTAVTHAVDNRHRRQFPNHSVRRPLRPRPPARRTSAQRRPGNLHLGHREPPDQGGAAGQRGQHLHPGC